MSEKVTLKIGQGRPGPGRKKGVPNKVNSLLKDEILQAAADAHPDGRVAYLAQQAQENPAAFLTLLGKVLPTQINGPGDNGEHKVTVSGAATLTAFLDGIASRAVGSTDPE